MSGAVLKTEITTPAANDGDRALATMGLPANHRIGSNNPPGRPRTEWPEHRLQTLRILFDQGLSHELIAQRMWTTKGAVSGKIDRLGWTRSATIVALKPDRSAIAARAEERRAKTAASKAIEESTVGVTLLDLGPDMCRWPLAYADEWTFCGCRKVDGAPYCGEHDARSRSGAKGPA